MPREREPAQRRTEATKVRKEEKKIRKGEKGRRSKVREESGGRRRGNKIMNMKRRERPIEESRGWEGGGGVRRMVKCSSRKEEIKRRLWDLGEEESRERVGGGQGCYTQRVSLSGYPVPSRLAVPRSYALLPGLLAASFVLTPSHQAGQPGGSHLGAEGTSFLRLPQCGENSPGRLVPALNRRGT